MARRKRGSTTLVADRNDSAPAEPQDGAEQPDTLESTEADDALAELVAAETAAVEARERATAARARALELRRKATAEMTVELAPEPVTDDTRDVEVDDADEAENASGSSAPRTGIRALLNWKGLVIATALLLACAAVALSTIMVISYRGKVADERLAAEYSEAARGAATAFMAIDYTTARDDLQNILDVTTGGLREQYEGQSDSIISSMEESQVVTQVSVTDVAVESMDANTAVVLLSIRTQRTTGQNATPPEGQLPTLWRLALTMVHEGDQIKVSNMEYL